MARITIAQELHQIPRLRAFDAANDYAVFVNGTRQPDATADHLRVITHDIDLGAVEPTPACVEQQLRRVDALSPAAVRHARDAVLTYIDDRKVDVPGEAADPEDRQGQP